MFLLLIGRWDVKYEINVSIEKEGGQDNVIIIHTRHLISCKGFDRMSKS